MMKLLLAVDSLTTLNILLDEVTLRAWPAGTQARVLSIVEDEEVPLGTWREQGYGVSAVRQEMRRRGAQITALAVERLNAIGITTEVTIMRGDPQFLIVFASRKWSTDLILIRAHNRTDFRNWLLGSVAKSVVVDAPCSVEVIRRVDSLPASEVERDFRVLLATDGTNASLTAAQGVAEATWPESTQVKVVSVVNPIIYSLEESGLWRDKHTKRAHRAIGEAIRALKSAPLSITAEVIADKVVRGILDRAQSWHADLIILGTHDRRGIKRLFTRDNSTAIANRAHCSVRVVRGQSVSESHNSATRHRNGSAQNSRRAYVAVDTKKAA